MAYEMLSSIHQIELFASADGGATWDVLSALPADDAVALSARSSATELFLATRRGIVYGSTDAGATWTWRGSINQLTLTTLASDEPAATAVESIPGAGLVLGDPFPNPSRGTLSFDLRLSHDANVDPIEVRMV